MMAHRSIRSYTDKAVSDEDLDKIIRAVQAAPNWVNLQLVSIIAIKDAERRKHFSHLCGGQPYIAEAPMFLIFCADYNRAGNWSDLAADFYRHPFHYRGVAEALEGQGFTSIYKKGEI